MRQYSSLIDAPAVLERDSYDTVRRLMLRAEALGRKTAVLALTPELIADSREYIRRRNNEPVNIDRSLVGQLRALLCAPAKATAGQADSPPDAYLFTARSAIPVADCLRGFFDASGLAAPTLSHITANRSMSSLLAKPEDRIASVTEPLQEPHEAEIERLRSLVGGLDHVCVVEEFVGQGKTLRYAGALLSEAGVQAVSAIRGGWYMNAEPDDISVDSLTSRHSDFMYELGALASAA